MAFGHSFNWQKALKDIPKSLKIDPSSEILTKTFEDCPKPLEEKSDQNLWKVDFNFSFLNFAGRRNRQSSFLIQIFLNLDLKKNYFEVAQNRGVLIFWGGSSRLSQFFKPPLKFSVWSPLGKTGHENK